MISSKCDQQADALYLRLTSRKIARTVEIDSGTLADVESAGRLVGVEVIRPGRDWPVDDILTRFDVSEQQARELRAQHRKTSHRGGGGHGGTTIGVIAVIGTAVVVGVRVVLRALSRVPVC